MTKKNKKEVDNNSPSHTMWLSYRCFRVKGEEAIPLLGSQGIAGQIGSVEYARPRRFREKLEQWLEFIRALWPECPARINSDRNSLIVNQACAVHELQRAADEETIRYSSDFATKSGCFSKSYLNGCAVWFAGAQPDHCGWQDHSGS